MKKSVILSAALTAVLLMFGACSSKCETAAVPDCQKRTEATDCAKLQATQYKEVQIITPEKVVLKTDKPLIPPKQEEYEKTCTDNVLAPNCVLRVRAMGQGVAPVNTVSPAQALALAKRAAIVDAYRQLGEKITGVRIEGRDLIKNMMVHRSNVITHLDAIIKGAEVVDQEFKDGLYQIEMEVSIRGDRWYHRFADSH